VAAGAREEGAEELAVVVEPAAVVEQVEAADQAEDREAVAARAADRMRCGHMQSSPTSRSCDFRQTGG
jgi:hypothetical protein